MRATRLPRPASPRYRPRPSLLLLGVAAALAQAPCAAEGPPKLVYLDYRPLTDPVSLQVSVAAGQARAARYSPHRLAVLEVFGAPLLAAEAQELERLAAAAHLQEPSAGAIHEQIPEEGDLFILRLDGPGGLREIQGLLHRAAPPVRALVERLRALPDRLPRLAATHAYLRCEVVAPARLALIRRRGRMRLVAFAELPLSAVAALRAAAAGPGTFHPLDPESFQALLAHGREFVVVEADAALQVTLFTAGGTSEQQPPSGREDR